MLVCQKTHMYAYTELIPFSLMSQQTPFDTPPHTHTRARKHTQTHTHIIQPSMTPGAVSIYKSACFSVKSLTLLLGFCHNVGNYYISLFPPIQSSVTGYLTDWIIVGDAFLLTVYRFAELLIGEVWHNQSLVHTCGL